MGVFSSIMGKIFGGGAQAAPAQAAPSMPTGNTSPGSAPTSAAPSGDWGAGGSIAPSPAPVAPGMAGSPAPAPASPTTGAATTQQVDVAAVLSEMAGRQGQKLDWRKSIVDLMKLLGIDSSLANRKELAKELGYTGDTNDSATMNVWLHKAVMRKLAENGGRVPAELKD